MNGIVTKSNLTKAGVLGVAALLAMKLTAGKSALWQGAGVVAALAVAIPLSAKVGG